MVTTRADKSRRSLAQSPLREVGKSRRPSRLGPATYAEYFTDDDDDDDLEDDLLDSDYDAGTRKAVPNTQMHAKCVQHPQHGGPKTGRKGISKGNQRKSGQRRSSSQQQRVAALRAAVGRVAGGGSGPRRDAGGLSARRISGRQPQPPASGQPHRQSRNKDDHSESESEEDDEPRDTHAAAVAVARSGQKDLRRSARLSHDPPINVTRNVGDAAGDDGDDDAMDDSDSGGEQRQRTRTDGQGLHSNGHTTGDHGEEDGEEEEEDIDDDEEEHSDVEEEEEEEDKAGDPSSCGEEDGEGEEADDDGGVRKGRYLLRGPQVNPLMKHPAKRPRYSDEPPGEGANRRGGGGRGHDIDGGDDDDSEDEEGPAEDEDEDGSNKRHGNRSRNTGRARPRKGGGSKGPARRYTLRDRSRMVPMSVQEQRRQREELKQREARKRSRGQGASGGKHGGGGGGGGTNRRSGGGWGWRSDASDDDIPDVDGTSGGHPWRSIHQAMGQFVPWQAGGFAQAAPSTPMPGQAITAHGGAQVVPSSAAHMGAAAAAAATPGLHGAFGGGGAAPLAPWEQALLLDSAALAAGAGGKEKAGNAEINPVAVDPSVGFDQVGGLDSYIEALKEMVFLPLVYPELFTRFNVQPPRGVLFYGPPGTGKTLVARALAAHATRYGGRKVSFYMRKGADVLSKWVGEAERQLRLLFEEAQRNAPAIIFFDEIDGLAPVRSSRQDQIHNSIVSTLLALMDGLDSRGQVVVIGATNRPDALDGALRRPGRFDRELLFPLPGLQARRSILEIHTRKWSERPSPQLLDELAGLCVGYCGADLKAVCAEAALHAVRRRYPQIYASEDKLIVEPSSVRVERGDFLAAIAAITPASNRSAAAHARPLSGGAAPCLASRLAAILGRLKNTFPPAAQCLAAVSTREGRVGGEGSAAAVSAPSTSLILPPGRAGPSGVRASVQLRGGPCGGTLGSLLSRLPSFLVTRPRLLLCGPAACGQSQLAAALLYALEGLPAHAIGLPALLANPGARSPEEALVWAIVEARRSAPAILYLPHLQLWWQTAPPQLRATLVMLLRDLPPELPLLLLATADVPFYELDREVRTGIFHCVEDVVGLQTPTEQQRRDMLQEPIMAAAEPVDPALLTGLSGVPSSAVAAAEPLPKDPSVGAARAAEARITEELVARRAYEDDQGALRALRMALRGVTLTLLNERRWKQFSAPVDPDEDPEYWRLVSVPMDLATVLARVDGRQYLTISQYLADVALILQGAREYFIDSVRDISRATALVDEAEHLVKARVPLELAKRCEDMLARGGPAPPPPGMELPEELAAARAKAAAARTAAAGGGGTGSAGCGMAGIATGGAGTGVYVTRQRAGGQVGHSDGPCVPMFDDPEALLRKTRLLQQREREQQASVAGATQAGRSSQVHAQQGLKAEEPAIVDDGKEVTSPPDRADPQQQLSPGEGKAGPRGLVESSGAAATVGNGAIPGMADGGVVAAATKRPQAVHAEGKTPAAEAVMDVGVMTEMRNWLHGKHFGTQQQRKQLKRIPRSATRTSLEPATSSGDDGVETMEVASDSDAEDQPPLQPQLQSDIKLQVHGSACPAAEFHGELEHDPQDPVALDQAKALLERTVVDTEAWPLESLELLYTRAAAVLMDHVRTRDRRQVVAALEECLLGSLAASAGTASAAWGEFTNFRAR
ncbi:hypothetical protein VaNZ11_002825 [Volvox africanus]|uniref:Bromo domain-containing protein n=1 Tax=Volvox africanus TaxID=51714 RepID=A0ABQ5RTQ7_9CHLO|nr:hypothetical protein VaNZ11_002825 [Volvox africanus]